MNNYFVFTREQLITAPIEDVWNFFSSPSNLKKITPASLSLIVKDCPANQGIYRGMKIRYTVKPLLQLPMSWLTEITEVNAPYSFSDVQVKGPYKLWHHTHRFIETGNGVLMQDVVKYHPGWGWAGKIINKFVVARKLREIFDYRAVVVQEIFKSGV